MNCNICPRACNINRKVSVGFCQKTNKMEISKVMIHYGEEPFLTSAQKPASGAIFFAGCNLKCVYCQNYSISHGSGKAVGAKTLAKLFVQLENAGAANIDLVTPTHYARGIIRALKMYKPKVPVIYNCGGYESEKTIKALAKYVDIFLFDLKYFDDALAIKYSSAPHYFSFASRAITLASSLKPNKFCDGQMISGVVIRHLVLPTHCDDSLKILNWLASTLGTDCYVSIMSQYLPCGNAKNYPEINRTLKPLEYKAVVAHAQKLGLKNALIQDICSNTDELIPDFDKFDKNFDY